MEPNNDLLKPVTLKGTTPRVSENLKAFFDEFVAGTSVNLLVDAERVWNGAVGLELHLRWGNAHISHIRTFPQLNTRGQGNASKALDWLCSLADKHQVTLDCFPKPSALDPEDKKTQLTKPQLVSWYTRHEFVTQPNGEMVRQPKTEPFVLKLKGPMRTIPIENE